MTDCNKWLHRMSLVMIDAMDPSADIARIAPPITVQLQSRTTSILFQTVLNILERLLHAGLMTESPCPMHIKINVFLFNKASDEWFLWVAWKSFSFLLLLCLINASFCWLSIVILCMFAEYSIMFVVVIQHFFALKPKIYHVRAPKTLSWSSNYSLSPSYKMRASRSEA